MHNTGLVPATQVAVDSSIVAMASSFPNTTVLHNVEEIVPLVIPTQQQTKQKRKRKSAAPAVEIEDPKKSASRIL